MAVDTIPRVKLLTSVPASFCGMPRHTLDNVCFGCRERLVTISSFARGGLSIDHLLRQLIVNPFDIPIHSQQLALFGGFAIGNRERPVLFVDWALKGQ